MYLNVIRCDTRLPQEGANLEALVTLELNYLPQIWVLHYSTMTTSPSVSFVNFQSKYRLAYRILFSFPS
jgi:hypothetical protein